MHISSFSAKNCKKYSSTFRSLLSEIIRNSHDNYLDKWTRLITVTCLDNDSRYDAAQPQLKEPVVVQWRVTLDLTIFVSSKNVLDVLDEFCRKIEGWLCPIRFDLFSNYLGRVNWLVFTMVPRRYCAVGIYDITRMLELRVRLVLTSSSKRGVFFLEKSL